MTIAEKLRGLAAIAERDPSDLRWRLLCLLDEIDPNEPVKAAQKWAYHIQNLEPLGSLHEEAA